MELSEIQQELVRLAKAGDTGSKRYKRLRAKVQKCANAKAYAEGPSLSPWEVNHIYGSAANHRRSRK